MSTNTAGNNNEEDGFGKKAKKRNRNESKHGTKKKNEPKDNQLGKFEEDN